MTTRREPLVAVLAGWTLFVWTTRIGNIWRDDAATTGDKVGSTALALSFTALAVALLVAHVQRRGWLGGAVLLAAGWTTGVWLARWVVILGDDRGAGFIAVHTVLAVVSIGLAVAALRAVRRAGADAGTGQGSPQPTAAE